MDMMKEQQNEWIQERYQLAMERCYMISTEVDYDTPLCEYFHKTSHFIQQIGSLMMLIEENQLHDFSLEQLRQLNHSLYKDIEGDTYETSYANPSYAVAQLGEEFGAILAFLYTEIRGMIVYAYEGRRFELTALCELFIEIYNLFAEETLFEQDVLYEEVRDAIYSFYHDYADVFVEERLLEQLSPDRNFAVQIIQESDLFDVRYLYRFGEYISENELATARFLASLPQEEIDAMAAPYTEGFRQGYLAGRMDMSKKKHVNIRYSLGFERIVKAAIVQFEKMGLTPVIYRAGVSVMNRSPHGKIGYCSTSPNKQYDYDHRQDQALYLNRAFSERKLECLRTAYEHHRELAAAFAGPACIEIFGEEPFAPVHKEEALSLSREQEELVVYYQGQSSQLSNQYMPRDSYSFTIIAYPIPEIGENFETIFRETVRINTLDMKKYEKIQAIIIDALNQAEHVRIKGAGENRTDLTVALQKLSNPETETLFENCVADVNIPVGEVFTSPRLTGTNGVLHVSSVYLGDLHYKNLSVTFRDGMIVEYDCENFEDREANQQYVKQNVLFNRDTLPMGEFAIGTNTTAYKMAERFQIIHKLPILIVEKMGPHFAVGDTCYSYSEENRVYNPDGKEIVAKDNECSILRKEDMQKAYFNCHTDITIPYEEIQEIVAVCKNGTEIPVIRAGRFVLPGTEELNIPLDEK
ncbi:MAG: aminopeptidase [Lachnospiraceae bacterium]